MFRSLLVRTARLAPSKGMMIKNNLIIPMGSRMLLHTSPVSRNNPVNNPVNNQVNKNASTKRTEEPQPDIKSNNYDYSYPRSAKFLTLLAFCGALYFVSPYKLSINKKVKESKPENTGENSDTVTDSEKETTTAITNEEKGPEQKNAEGLEGIDTGKLAETEEEVNKEGAYDPETGEINWDCPCLGGMADGPCGEEFKEAFACFVYSGAEPKGIDCVDKFQNMQTCFRKYPEHYAEQLKDEEEINKDGQEKLEANDNESGSENTKPVSIELPNNESNDTIPDISKEEPVIVEAVPEKNETNTKNKGEELTEEIEDIELTESS